MQLKTSEDDRRLFDICLRRSPCSFLAGLHALLLWFYITLALSGCPAKFKFAVENCKMKSLSYGLNKIVMWFKKQKKRFWIWGEGEPVTTQPVCRIRRLSRRSKVSHQSARTALTNKQREKKSEVNKTTLWSTDCQHLCPTFNLPTVPIVADESQPACAPSCYGLVLEQTLWFLADYVATALLIKRPTQTHWYTKTSKPIHCFEFQRILQLFHFLTQITSHSHVML